MDVALLALPLSGWFPLEGNQLEKQLFVVMSGGGGGLSRQVATVAEGLGQKACFWHMAQMSSLWGNFSSGGPDGQV